MRSPLQIDRQHRIFRTKRCLWLMLVLITCRTTTLAQQNTLEAVVEKIIEQPASGPTLRTSANHSQAYLVQLKDGVRKEELSSSGVAVLRILNRHLYIIEGTTEKASTLPVKNIWPVNDLWKLSDDLLLSKHTAGEAHYTVKVKDQPGTKVLTTLPGLQPIRSGSTIFTVFTSWEVVKSRILPLPEVVYVGIESTRVHEESPVLDLNLQPNTVNRIHHAFPHLNGEGMVLSIQEQLYQSDDLDLRGRHIPSDASATQVSKHATEMATIAAGAGNSFVTGKGVAWRAGITSSAFDDLLPDADQQYATLQAWVQNHSYGTVIENFYGARAEAFDASSNRNPMLLHVFSSGNEGHTTSTSGPYQGIKGFANLTGNFKMSKNSLTVGCVDTLGRPMPFSSRGPAYDGRIKPEVVAYSTAGSSNAAALVSGIVLLLQQAYLQQEGHLPPSALLKALLINSATDAGQAGLDHITGYGNVDSYQALTSLARKQYRSGKVNQGETATFALQIPSHACRLKITLGWNDPAASPNASMALVNDLDMQLSGNQGRKWLPWVLNTSADAGSLTLPAFRAADHLNTIEQITLDSLTPGTYTLSVEGFDISSGPQEFYVAYQWDTLGTFEWCSPTGSDNMPYNGETDTYFQWKSTLPDTVGRLEYSLDAGHTWQVLADSLPLRGGKYRWHVPHLIAVAQARMVAGSKVYPTDPFPVSYPLALTVGYNCADSLLLSWKPAAAEALYEVSIFEENTLKPIFSISDTLLVWQKNHYPEGLLCLQPLLRDGIRGIRSPVLPYTQLPSSCFLVSFHAESAGETGIELITQLGTTFGVGQVFFERETQGQFETIGSADVQSSQVTFTDTQPRQGLNTYRTCVVLANGKKLISETAKSYFLREPPFILFPNPVSRADKLQIFFNALAGQAVVFRLYRTDGIPVLTTRLFSSQESISVHSLTPGLYLYSVQIEKENFTGKIIIY